MTSKTKLKAIIFDMDGTLTDTIDAWLASLNETLAVAGVPKIERNVYAKKWWGMDSHNKIRLMTGITNKEGIEKLYKYLVKRLIENFQHTKLMPKVAETIPRLKKMGLRLGVVSNSSMDVVETQLHSVGLMNYFSALVADSEPKPSPQGINSACRMLGVSKDEAMFVGDSSFDVAAGKNAEIRTVILDRDIKDMAGLMDIVK